MWSYESGAKYYGGHLWNDSFNLRVRVLAMLTAAANQAYHIRFTFVRYLAYSGVGVTP
jgi:hypothetical protein